MVYGAKQRIVASQLHGLALSFSIAVGLVGSALLLGFEHLWVTTVLTGMSWATVVLVAVSIAPLLYAQVMGAMLTGMGHVPAISVMRIALAVATPAVTVPAVLIWGRAVSAVSAWLIITTVYAIVLWWYASTRIARPARPTWDALREATSYSLRVYVGSLAAQGFLRIDFFFVSAYMGPRAVGIYSQASVMAERMTTFGQAVYSSSAHRLGSDPLPDAAQLAASLVRLLLLVMVPVGVVLAVFARPLIVLLYGARFAAAGEPFAILLPGTVCLTLWYIVSMYVMSSLHRPGATTLIQGSALILAVPLYWLAVHQWGFNGAAAVSTLVYVFVFLAGLSFLVRSPYVGWRDLVPTHRDARIIGALVGRGVARLRSRRGRSG
jgi:O-antigen/teichoic acid export membrane protein